MATRQDVVTAINAIENNGNNTAKEVRDVLTKLLDYTENVESSPNTSNLIPFEYNNSKRPVQSDASTKMLYSFRGFENVSVNFSFMITNLDGTNGLFTFKLEPGLFSKLKKIIMNNHMTFSIPIISTQRNPDNPRDPNKLINLDSTAAVSISLKAPDSLTMQFLNVEFHKESIIYSSIQFHVPDFFGE